MRGLYKERAAEAFNEAVLDYDKYKEEFKEWLFKEVSKETAEQYLRDLEQTIAGKKINDPHELYNIYKDYPQRHHRKAIRTFMRFLIKSGIRKKSELMDFQAVIDIPGTQPRPPEEAFTTDEKIIEALNSPKVKKDERRQILIRLLAYTGLRLREALELLRTFDKNKLEFHGNYARYPTYELKSKAGTKRTYYAYMPADFARQLKRIDIKETTVKGAKLADRIILPEQLRKWHTNFLKRKIKEKKLQLGVTAETLINFIQGRVGKAVIDRYYLDLVEDADELYTKIADEFPF
ncbi:integrase [Archaeoglobus veneficus]|uniref:Integrase SSV1 C-terminal domain-containing protein n=1 Tax=Archaeoglobus veneficus (strain DSM 11195 / SNP6) TaxID=693661 RepID=F2KR66_ARCVS|nr:integrase [Archaeoglobus veneficus]AEA46703.1 hypothetical protein Arcve_0683 [Archaeoglobus veneficus SNP6]